MYAWLWNLHQQWCVCADSYLKNCQTVSLSDSVATLTPSMPAAPNCCCSNGLAPYWSNPQFLIFDIRALWHSFLSARVPECQKLKMVGLTSVAKCKALTGSAVKGLRGPSATMLLSLITSLIWRGLIAPVQLWLVFLVTFVDHLHSVLNAAACLVCRAPKYGHITRLLCDLYWLCVPGVLVFRCSHSMMLLYLTDDLHWTDEMEALQWLCTSCC